MLLLRQPAAVRAGADPAGGLTCASPGSLHAGRPVLRGRRGRRPGPARATRPAPGGRGGQPCRSPGRAGCSPRPTRGSCSAWRTTPAPRTACSRRRRSSSPPASVVGPGAPIPLPDGIGRVDAEAELAVVIGTHRPPPDGRRRARRRARLHGRQRRHRPRPAADRPAVDRRQGAGRVHPARPVDRDRPRPVDAEITGSRDGRPPWRGARPGPGPGRRRGPRVPDARC